MRVELLDLLRCPAEHEDSWLVLSADTWQDVHVASGRLGCPVCRAEYPISGGVANFSASATIPVAQSPERLPGAGENPRDRVMRLAAQLDLREPSGVILLEGRYSALATELAADFVSSVVALSGDGLSSPGVSVIRIGDRLPVRSWILRAAAVDLAGVAGFTLAEVVRVLRSGARLVAPAAIEPVDGLSEVARDDQEWVGSVIARPQSGAQLLRRKTGIRPP